MKIREEKVQWEPVNNAVNNVNRTNTVVGLLSGLSAAAIWGGMYVVSKVVMAVVPPFLLIVMRLALGILTLTIIMFVRRG